jgi:hypothetical protein
LEKLAAMVGRIWCGAAVQLPFNERFAFGELELYAAALPGAAAVGGADARFGNCRFVVAGISADWLGMDRRICSGIDIQANAVDKRDFVLLTLFVLFIALPR